MPGSNPGPSNERSLHYPLIQEANTKGFIYNDFGEECAEIYADSSSILHIVLALHFMIMMMVGSHLAKIDQLLSRGRTVRLAAPPPLNSVAKGGGRSYREVKGESFQNSGSAHCTITHENVSLLFYPNFYRSLCQSLHFLVIF